MNLALSNTFSTKAVVTSPHTLASEQGLNILRQGGNAIEAAIATATTLSVLYPHFNGLGGDAFMVISDASGDVTTISGIGQSFQNLPKFDSAIPTRGIHSAITTAGTVDTWGKAYDYSKQQWYGKIAWAALFEAAISYAEKGFTTSSSQQFWYDFRKDDISDWTDFNAIYGNTLSSALFKQSNLATTLRQIALYGAREFYEGALAERIVKGLTAAGSTICLSDLVNTHANLEFPLSTAYRDGILYGLRPPTQGITTLEIMGILQQFNLKKEITEGSSDYYHLLIEAIKLAFIDRNRQLADPDFTQFDYTALLNPNYLSQQANKIVLEQAMPWEEKFQTGDTVYIGVVDNAGNCVSMLQTVYYDWGSGIIAGDTGILWHNRGAAFSPDKTHPNFLQPKKRPFHTLNPGIYVKDGKPNLLYGTQGADGQPQTLATVLTRAIDYDFLPFEALAAPRFLLGKTFSSSKDNLKIEEDVGKTVIAALMAKGHNVETLSAHNALCGQPGLIKITPEGIYAAHDPRSDGIALGL